MKTIAVDGSEDSFENGLIQSLSYLYAETLRKNYAALADVIEPMLDKCFELVSAGGSLPAESEDALKLHLILRKFRRLGNQDKQAFVRLLEVWEEGGESMIAALQKAETSAVS
jgi:hypothetical protein